MLNYIRSECYRIAHSGGIYGMTGIAAVLAALVNFTLFWAGRIAEAGFAYDTVSFSLGLLASSPMAYCYMALLTAGILYGEDRKNGVVKNAVAYGISRSRIFVGKCIAGTAAASVSMLLIWAAYVGSAFLLLPKEGEDRLGAVLLQLPAMLLIAVAALVLGIVVLGAFERNVTGILVWLIVMAGAPAALFYIGRAVQSETLTGVALWMPANFLKQQVRVTMNDCAVLWDNRQGMAKCLLSGAAGIIIFGITGTRIGERE